MKGALYMSDDKREVERVARKSPAKRIDEYWQLVLYSKWAREGKPMDVNSALQAAGSSDLLQQMVGIRMLDMTMQASVQNSVQLVNDFAVQQQKIMAASVQPHLGQCLDIRI